MHYITFRRHARYPYAVCNEDTGVAAKITDDKVEAIATAQAYDNLWPVDGKEGTYAQQRRDRPHGVVLGIADRLTKEQNA